MFPVDSDVLETAGKCEDGCLACIRRSSRLLDRDDSSFTRIAEIAECAACVVNPVFFRNKGKDAGDR